MGSKSESNNVPFAHNSVHARDSQDRKFVPGRLTRPQRPDSWSQARPQSEARCPPTGTFTLAWKTCKTTKRQHNQAAAIRLPKRRSLVKKDGLVLCPVPFHPHSKPRQGRDSASAPGRLLRGRPQIGRLAGRRETTRAHRAGCTQSHISPPGC